MSILRTVWFYVEYIVAALLIFILLLSRVLNNFLTAWDAFIVSYLISRVIIWFLADYLKIRLLRPLNEATSRRPTLAPKVNSEKDAAHLEDYAKMKYQALRDLLNHPDHMDAMSGDAFRSFASAYTYKVQKTIVHIHHFILGIILMPLTWIFYFYHLAWAPPSYPPISLGMVTAGATFALFMSEFYQLLTQEWGP